jgi:RNA polymerase sigma-70 factor (ECF subfamily)
MAVRATGPIQGDLLTLFQEGALGGLSDGQLLERFMSGRDYGAEAAFAALVQRHGSMVLRLCRTVLGDEHLAQDAAQAVFLVLARRAGSIRRRESIGGWLYGVSRRVAKKVRSAGARRREVEQRRAAMADRRDDPGEGRPLGTEIYEELDRLPERYRAPIVLCCLEGLTHEQAAQRLQCPIRTLQTRLTRGKGRLRERLTRRGLAPATPGVGLSLAAPTTLPAAWVEATVRAGMVFTTKRMAAGVVSAAVAGLAEGVLHTMLMKQLGYLAGAVLLLGGLAWGGGEFVQAKGPPRREGNPPAPSVPAQAQSKVEKKSDDAPRELAFDSGKMAGRRSIAGSGHAVKFEALDDGWTLTAVKIHGARYGYPQPPQEDFKVFLCDDQFKTIAEFPFPYSKFERREAKWVTLGVKPTAVPKAFIVCVGFNPEQTKGVYLSHDEEGSGHSLVGLPGSPSRPFDQGDWLIRAQIAPGK